MPAVSIIVPIYNAADYLEKCLDSIVGQTLKDIEIICVNDGSTDTSLEIINRYASPDERIKVIDKPNAGYGAAMNDGIKAATGEYIGIVEPDDYIDEDMYASLVEIATSQDREVDLVKSAWRTFENDDDEGNVVDPYENLPEKALDLEETPSPLLPHPSIWSGIYKKDMLDKHSIRFKEIPGAGWADNPFFLETLYFAEAPVFTSKHFYNYRINNATSSSELKDVTIPFSRLTEMLDFLDEHPERKNFRKAVFWRAFPYLRSTMNALAYPDKSEQAKELITEFFKRMPENMIDDSCFSKEDKHNYMAFVSEDVEIPACENPKVSLVVPCYNVAKYINKCVDSLSRQTMQDFEVIFVDDGSSDYTRAKLYARTLHDKRMTVVTQPNSGAGAARNRGLKMAKGQYITFLDSDDIYEPTLLEDSYNRAIDTNADLVIYGADFYYEKTKTYEDVSWLDLGVFPDKTVFKASDIEHQNIFKSTNGWTWDKLFKTSFIRENDISFQEIRTHNDMLFTYTAFLLASAITVCNKKLIHQRKGHGTSLSQTGGRSWWCADEALSALENALREHGIYDRFERDFKNYVVHIFKYSTDNMRASDCIGKLYNAIKDEWIAKFDLPQDPDYYCVEWERDWFMCTLSNSTEDILIQELQKEIKAREKAESAKKTAQKKLKEARAENKSLSKKVAGQAKQIEKIKASKSYKTAKKVSNIFRK